MSIALFHITLIKHIGIIMPMVGIDYKHLRQQHTKEITVTVGKQSKEHIPYMVVFHAHTVHIS